MHHLLDGDGSLLVEVADDRVSGATMGDATRITSWREIEVELKADSAARLQERVGKRLLAAGASRSDFGSKLQRTLGFPGHARTTPHTGTVGGLAWVYWRPNAERSSGAISGYAWMSLSCTNFGSRSGDCGAR